MPKKNNKRKANIYMDSTGIYYVILSKKDHIMGKIIFDVANLEDETSNSNFRIKKLKTEIQILKKKSKIKEFNIILTDGIRLVKVLKFEKDIRLNNDVDLILKEEISNFLQPSENINDFELNFFKTGKKTQNIFLTSLIKRKHVIDLCNMAIQDSINLECITLPEIAMYNIIKELNGVNVVLLYDEGKNELRTLVCRGQDFIYSNQINSVLKEDIDDEIKKLDIHLRNQYKIIVNSITLIGCDKINTSKDLKKESDIGIEEIDNSINTEENQIKEQIDNRYLLLMGI